MSESTYGLGTTGFIDYAQTSDHGAPRASERAAREKSLGNRKVKRESGGDGDRPTGISGPRKSLGTRLRHRPVLHDASDVGVDDEGLDLALAILVPKSPPSPEAGLPCPRCAQPPSAVV
jgi:hypothetical protein